MSTPTTEHETVLGILRELRDELLQNAERHRWNRVNTKPPFNAFDAGTMDAYGRVADRIQQWIDAIEREGES